MSRIFTARNTRRAKVFDVDTKQEIDAVVSVDIDAGVLVRHHKPLRVVGDEIDSYTEYYRSIYPIYGDSRHPQLFHCYGKQAPSPRPVPANYG